MRHSSEMKVDGPKTENRTVGKLHSWTELFDIKKQTIQSDGSLRVMVN